MSDRKPPPDLGKQPPGEHRDVEEELADSPALAGPDEPTPEAEPDPELEQRGYAPRHRAPGRAPLIRRRRNRGDDPEEGEVTWETTWRERDENAGTRWVDQEESIVAPSRPIEEVPYLASRRSERKKVPPGDEEEASQELIRRRRDYTGRHLAPKKPAPWSRGAEDEVEEFADRSEIDRLEARSEAPSREPRTLVEGDVRDEPDSGLFARPWRSRRSAREPSAPDSSAEEVSAEAAAAEATPDEVTPDPSAPEPAAAAPAEVVAAAQPAEVPEPEPEPEPEAEAPQPEPEAEAPQPASPAPPALASAPEPPHATVPAGVEEPAPEADEDDGAHEVEAADEADEADEATPLGPRTAALQERKKKKKVRQTAGGIVAVAAVVAAVIGVGLLAKRVVDPPRQRVAVPLTQPAAASEGGTTLLFGTREDAGAARGAIWMTLFSYDVENDKASIVYIPPHTAVEVPGRGLQGVGEAYGSGGIPLLLVATENLLGVSVDRYVELSDKDARVFFEGLGSLTVDVPAEVRVPAGKDQARLIFVEGPQELTPELLVRLLYIVGIEGDDVELGSRHLAFWDALFDEYDEPDEVAELIKEAGAALGESDVAPDEHAKFFGSIADLPPEQLTITMLPVRPISAGDSELYATDADELAEFVAATIGAGRDKPAEVRVQVLNGNGVPGIGQEVADRLVGEGFRVILSGNARRLNYRETLVITYDPSEAGIALAERARDLLGVGEVQVSAQQQGIVDLTIVVGKDFLRAR